MELENPEPDLEDVELLEEGGRERGEPRPEALDEEAREAQGLERRDGVGAQEGVPERRGDGDAVEEDEVDEAAEGERGGRGRAVEDEVELGALDRERLQVCGRNASARASR